jgi:hypothetical protein
MSEWSHLSTISKLLLAAAVLTAIVNLAFSGGAGDWAIPVMIAIASSPAFRPNKLNLLLAAGTLCAKLVAQLGHSLAAAKVAISLAIACMLLAILKGRGAKSS